MNFHVIKRILLTLLICIFTGAVLQLVVFSLPTERMFKHVKESIPIFEQEDNYNSLVPGFSTTQLDNYTDATMLMIAIYNGEQSVLEKMCGAYRYVIDGQKSAGSLIQYCKSGISDSISEYSRYWHGYLLFLKPLLLIFNYGEIRLLNMYLQYIILFIFLFSMYKYGYKKYILPFIAGFLLISPPTINMSLQFSACYYLMLTGGIILMHFYEKLKQTNSFFILFLIIGICTSFFDFLTYPLATFGIPLILFLLRSDTKFKRLLQNFIDFGTCWSTGYIGMWGGKWLIAYLFLPNDSLSTVISKINQRSFANGGNSEGYSLYGMLTKNFQWIHFKPYLCLLAVIFIYELCCLLKYGINYEQTKVVILLILTAFLPAAWYILAGNHSFIHFWFTYRSCIITIFALFSIPPQLQALKKKEG